MNISKFMQDIIKKNMTLEDLLPTQMPVYVNSFAYFFGTMTISSIAVIFATGVVLSIFGPDWWHFTAIGAFVNAMHFWSVEVFYLSVMLHMTFKFFKAAWRDGRERTWMNGWIIFAVSIFSGITGTLLQGNWDSQWNSQQGKDAFNAMGLGWLGWLNYTTVLTLHIVFFAAIVLILIMAHITFVRSESPVRPIVEEDEKYIEKAE